MKASPLAGHPVWYVDLIQGSEVEGAKPGKVIMDA